MKQGLRQRPILAQNLYLKQKLRIATISGLVLLGIFTGVFLLQPVTFYVTNTADAGPGSLRQAIQEANTHWGKDRIEFQIPGEGPHRIVLNRVLPHISHAVTIDGYSQAGSAPASDSLPARIQIEIQGHLLSEGSGLTLIARDCLIRGLAINGFDHDARIAAIFIHGKANRIEGNFLGTDASGKQARPNAQGIYLLGASGNIIGGPAPEQRNLLSGNSRLGIHLESNAQIRCKDNRIQGNYLGLAADGRTSLGNGAQGILDQGSLRTEIADNVISANGEGIEFVGSGSLHTEQARVIRNKIGTDASGQLPMGNLNRGMVIRQARNCQIGGEASADGNLIAYNRSVGILLTSAHTQAILMLSNLIHSNEEQGIDLSMEPYGFPDAINPNDVSDTDEGPNDLQNYPILLYAQRSGNHTILQYQFESEADADYVLQFFAAPAGIDSKHWGEGQRLLLSERITTDANGLYAAEISVADALPEGAWLSATASHLSSGSTSEFSLPKIVAGQDTDRDGIADSQDLDDDNDGIPDLQECLPASGHALTADPAGDEDHDGIPNYQDQDFASRNHTGSSSAWDSDSDGIPDFLDLDSDNDGIPDLIEAGGIDINGDGQIDLVREPGRDDIFYIDFAGDGIADSGSPDVWDQDADGWADLYDDDIAGQQPGTPLPCSDHDGNGKPDFQDTVPGAFPAGYTAFSDADGDGFNDAFDPVDNDEKADNDLAFDRSANKPKVKTGPDPDRDGHVNQMQGAEPRILSRR